MKLIHYIYISAALVLLSACNDEEVLSPTYTVGEADNAIVLGAGIAEGGSGVQTRAVANPDANHAKHLLIEGSSKLFLRIDGDWKKTAEGAATPISQTTTATVGGASSSVDSDPGKLHNSLAMDPVRYWDDYGTADPNNAFAGRTKGLTIYGAGVNDGTSAVPTIDGTTGKTWTELYWNVGEASSTTPAIIDQNTTNYWKAKDLITSNNVVYSETSEQDNAYKFENRASGKLLEFTHAMTKITVNLTANEGFTVPTGGSEKTFKENVSVTLLGFNYMGKVDIEGKTSNPTDAEWNLVDGSHAAATANIKAKLMEGGKDAHTAKFEALVFPGNTFTATIANDANKTLSSDDPLLELNADGNIYKITAAQLVKAIAKKDNNNNEPNAGTYNKTLAQGVNYVINIIVNKTEINVEATIKDWDEIDADEEAPVINISANYGQTTTTGVGSFNKTYDFFRSTTKASGYDENNTENGINPAATFTYSGSSYTQNKVLYWPNHDTHYFFRGVYPVIGTNSTGYSSPETALAISTNSSSKEVIEVSNVAYDDNTWPSDLAIALPRTTNDACTNHSKTPLDYGICATKGTITMNFEYAMSKVEVRLKSSDNTTDEEYVDLTNITVEVVGGYNKGRITLEDGLHDTWVDTSDKGDYTLHNTTAVTGFQKTTQDAIIPQELGDDVKFKITVTNAQGKDIYYAQLNQIKGKKQGAADDTKAFITEWKHGEYYIYDLKVTKSVINVTATITDWVTVNASEDVWF